MSPVGDGLGGGAGNAGGLPPMVLTLVTHHGPFQTLGYSRTPAVEAEL